jgi:hypothetical protein
MLNGLLMTEGIDAISIPAVRAAEFNSRMVDFYITRDGTEMMAFVLDCPPEIAHIRQLNPGRDPRWLRGYAFVGREGAYL